MPASSNGDLDAGDDATVITPPPADRSAGGTQLSIVPAPSSSAPARDSLAPGAMVGEYRVEGRIGEGGMGIVFSAVHPVIGKRAAIKVLRNELGASSMTVERFIDEARVVNQIGHPNIVDVFAFGTLTDGRHYFVMEWLNGSSLRDRLQRGPMPLAQSCALVRALVRALEAAHAHGVVHRDLKPDNVFLVDVAGEAPHVKLLDFGIAKLATAEHRIERTASGEMIGTPQYIAPEQARGEAVDHRADIYALGGMLFELLTGRAPFVANNAIEVIAKHLMEPAVAPSTLVAGVPPALDALVLAMLAKAPDARPSLAELARVLDAPRDSAASLPVSASFATAPTALAIAAQTVPPAPARGGRGGTIAAIVAGVAAVALGVFAVVSQLRDPGASAPHAAAIAPAEVAPPVSPPPPVVAAPPTPPPTPAVVVAPAPAPIPALAADPLPATVAAPTPITVVHRPAHPSKPRPRPSQKSNPKPGDDDGDETYQPGAFTSGSDRPR